MRFLQQEPHFGQRVRQILAKEKEEDDGRTTFPFKSRTTVKIEGDEMEARNLGATTIRDPATFSKRRERETMARTDAVTKVRFRNWMVELNRGREPIFRAELIDPFSLQQKAR